MAYHLDGLIQHDVYHIGQIGLVRKIVSAKNHIDK